MKSFGKKNLLLHAIFKFCTIKRLFYSLAFHALKNVASYLRTVSQAVKHKSKFTSDKMSNMAEDEFYPWTERELNILKKHKEYHKYMVDYIQGLIREGPISFPCKKPTKTLPVTIKKTNKLLGEELDKYLKKKLTSNFGPKPKRSEERNFESLKSDLGKCSKYETR